MTNEERRAGSRRAGAAGGDRQGLRRLLRAVQRPARYIGGEPGQILKDPEAVEIRWALCFPDAYEIGMSHLGLRLLYSRLNADHRLWCERAFAPLPDMEAALRRSREPLSTLESKTPLAELDVLGFSLQHELSFTNVLLMLDLGGVPRRTADRSLQSPLVLAGGPTAFHPEPLAPFVDAVAIGDGEELAIEVSLLWAEARRKAPDRARALEALARHPSVYVPSLAELERDPRSRRFVVRAGPDGKVPTLAEAARVEDLDDYPFPADGPTPLTEAVFDRAAVEIARGCRGGCRFCQAGMVYRPARERSVASVLGCLAAQVRAHGYDEASLASLSTADYSEVEALVRGAASLLSPSHVALSVSSLRAHGLAPSVSEALASVRTSSLTLAPEAGTQRLRDVINKNVTEEEIFAGARAAVTRGRRRLKLYFMIGLPTETDDDVRAIADMAQRLQAELRSLRGGRTGLTLAVSTFVPKPHTPLQWAAALDEGEVLRRQELLRSAITTRGIELRPHDSRLSMVEALLSRADRAAADLVELAYEEGARFDGWDDLFEEAAWSRALSRWEVDADHLRAAIPVGARLPWDHLAAGPSRAYLEREHRRALRSASTPPCLSPDEGGGLTCNGCGLDCDLGRQAELLASARGLEAPGRETEAASARNAPPSRNRLLFEKSGELALLGHLDTMRLVARLLRRAGAPLAYSGGFHPKPRLSVAAPLPVGAEGLAEVADVGLEGGQDLEVLLAELRRLAPPGLVPLELRRLEAGEPGAGRALAAADWIIASTTLPDDVEARIEVLLASAELTVDRRKRGAVDVRPLLLGLAPAEARPLPGRLTEGTKAVRARVAHGNRGSVRPGEVVHLLGGSPDDVEMVRVALYAAPVPTPLR